MHDVQAVASLARRVRRGGLFDERPLIELLHTAKPKSVSVLMDLITTGGTWEVPRGRIDSILDTYARWKQIQDAQYQREFDSIRRGAGVAFFGRNPIGRLTSILG